jgi:hypothetical protein
MTKTKTLGVDPKIVAQLIASAVAWLLARYAGLDLPPEAEAGIAAVVGVLVGALAPAPKTVTVTDGTKLGGEAGYGLVEIALFLLILFIALAVLIRYVL